MQDVQKNKGTPLGFKLTVGSDDLFLSHRVIVVTIFVQKRPVLNLLMKILISPPQLSCKTKLLPRFGARSSSFGSPHICPPDFLAVDRGCNYVSREMTVNLAASTVFIEEDPIESPGTIGTIERFQNRFFPRTSSSERHFIRERPLTSNACR